MTMTEDREKLGLALCPFCGGTARFGKCVPGEQEGEEHRVGVGGQAGLEIGGNALREAGVDLGLGDLEMLVLASLARGGALGPNEKLSGCEAVRSNDS